MNRIQMDVLGKDYFHEQQQLLKPFFFLNISLISSWKSWPTPQEYRTKFKNSGQSGKQKSHQKSQAQMHKDESLVFSGEVDIFWDVITFFFFFTTWTKMATEDSETLREQKERSLHGLLYCFPNPAWVKFLWFRRNFILGREKKASCFQKLGALISLCGQNPEEMKVT